MLLIAWFVRESNWILVWFWKI